eukprot:g6677.t1
MYRELGPPKKNLRHLRMAMLEKEFNPLLLLKRFLRGKWMSGDPLAANPLRIATYGPPFSSSDVERKVGRKTKSKNGGSWERRSKMNVRKVLAEVYHHFVSDANTTMPTALVLGKRRQIELNLHEQQTYIAPAPSDPRGRSSSTGSTATFSRFSHVELAAYFAEVVTKKAFGWGTDEGAKTRWLGEVRRRAIDAVRIKAARTLYEVGKHLAATSSGQRPCVWNDNSPAYDNSPAFGQGDEVE